MHNALARFALMCALLAPSLPGFAAVNDEVRTTWRLIDYLAVDYAGAVDHGEVRSAFEYAEMQEFAGTIRTRIATLPAQAGSATLIARADALQRLVEERAPAATVRDTAYALGTALLTIYPLPLGPDAVPDLAEGAALYQQRCAGCHGAGGRGDGPTAVGMKPPPIDFTDAPRARQRSVFALYQIIHQGLDGTAMASYAELPEADQWSLALYVSTLAFPAAEAEAGRRRWVSDAALRAALPDLDTLAQTSPAMLSQQLGTEAADAAMAYLRRNPGAVAAADAGRLDLARHQLEASVAAYRAGDRAKARQLALSAYFDGFEPLEPLLATHGALLGRVEAAMNRYRVTIARDAPDRDVAAAAANIERLFGEVEAVIGAARGDFMSVLLGAMTILLREGLEAMLVVVAMLAFLRKAGRKDLIPYLHAGWIAALGAGVLTWLAATRLVLISGASRELTEGIGSALAAVVLLTVGLWMHHKSLAGRWQEYIREKLSAALTRRSAWALALLAFVVVYREVFETVLFYAALWSEGGGRPVLGGLLIGCALLAVLAGLMLKAARRLPIGRFFSWSSGLIAVLAVVLAGKGIAGLQEAGVLSVTPLDAPRIVWLGLFPNAEGLLTQGLVVVVVIAGFAYNHLSARMAPGSN